MSKSLIKPLKRAVKVYIHIQAVEAGAFLRSGVQKMLYISNAAHPVILNQFPRFP